MATPAYDRPLDLSTPAARAADATIDRALPMLLAAAHVLHAEHPDAGPLARIEVWLHVGADEADHIAVVALDRCGDPARLVHDAPVAGDGRAARTFGAAAAAIVEARASAQPEARLLDGQAVRIVRATMTPAGASVVVDVFPSHGAPQGTRLFRVDVEREEIH